MHCILTDVKKTRNGCIIFFCEYNEGRSFLSLLATSYCPNYRRVATFGGHYFPRTNTRVFIDRAKRETCRKHTHDGTTKVFYEKKFVFSTSAVKSRFCSIFTDWHSLLSILGSFNTSSLTFIASRFSSVRLVGARSLFHFPPKKLIRKCIFDLLTIFLFLSSANSGTTAPLVIF